MGLILSQPPFTVKENRRSRSLFQARQDDFHLPRLRYTYPRPYTEEQSEDTYNWMVGWDLLNASVCATDFVDHRSGKPAAADD